MDVDVRYVMSCVTEQGGSKTMLAWNVGVLKFANDWTCFMGFSRVVWRKGADKVVEFEQWK